MRKTTALTLMLAATTLVACDTREPEDDPMIQPGEELPRADQPAPMPSETMLSVAEFEAVGDAPATGAVPVRGTAELRRVTDDGALELHVRLEGLTEGDHAWHIHSAPCGQQGDILVPLSGAMGRDGVADDLDVGSDGVVERTITIDAEHARTLDLSRQYAVNVHQGEDDNPGPAVACANIGGTSAGTTGTTPTPNQPSGY